MVQFKSDQRNRSDEVPSSENSTNMVNGGPTAPGTGDIHCEFSLISMALVPSEKKSSTIERLKEIQNLSVEVAFSAQSVSVTLKGQHESRGEVSAHAHCRTTPSGSAMVLESSGANGGVGPIVYDIAMEIATELGYPLVSDRATVSDAAFKVWDHYLRNRGDVVATELPVGDWYIGAKSEEVFKTMTEDPTTWPGKEHPIWALWNGYKKEPRLLNALKSTGQVEITDFREHSKL